MLTAKKFIPKALLIHGFCWLLIIGYELCTIYFANLKTQPFQRYALYYGINIAFFYALIYVNDLWLNRHIDLVLSLIGYLVLLVLAIICKTYFDILYANPGQFDKGFEEAKKYIVPNTFRLFYFATLAGFYQAATYLSSYRKQAAEAKIAYRQQQLQPHLLFNTLNMIYNKVDAYSPSASRCVWLLSELMRYSLDPGTVQGKVRVSDETVQLENLVKLNKARFGPDMALSVRIGEMGEARIIPLVLLTLTENLFKHGDLLDPAEPAFLTLELIGQRICFKTSNRCRLNDAGVSGIGLENTRIRLEHAYGKNYRLLTGYNAGRYELYLEVSA